MDELKQAIHIILKNHNLHSKFTNSTYERPWNTQIVSQEAGKPLALHRHHNTLTIALYTVSTYDIDYDPLITIDMTLEWKVVSIYRFHTGLLVVDKTCSIQDAHKQCRELASHLMERHYHDTQIAAIVHNDGQQDQDGIHEMYRSML
jgi:hypothetical protein